MARKRQRQATKQKEKIYESGDYLVIFDETYPNNFYLAVCQTDVYEPDTEFEGMVCLMGSRSTTYHPSFIVEALTSLDVLGFVTPKERQLSNLKIVYDPAGQSYESEEEAKITASEFRKLCALAEARKIAEDGNGLTEAEDEEDELDEAEGVSETGSKTGNSSRKIKRISGPKT